MPICLFHDNSGVRRAGSLAPLTILVCLAGLAYAQINTGRIDGAVRDSSGAVVPGARLSATNDATGALTTTQSSASGDYVVNFLVPGTYHVSVEKEGFQRSVISGVIVNAGGITRADFSLAVGQVQQACRWWRTP